MAFANNKQGSSSSGGGGGSNKKDFSHQKSGGQGRGNNRKWAGANNNNNNNRGGGNNNGGTTQQQQLLQQQQQRQQLDFVQDEEMTRHCHDRMLFLLANLTGSVVQVTVKSGAKFEGVFHGASTEGDIGVVLKHARKIHDPAATQSEKDKLNPYPVKGTVLILGKDVVEINSFETDLTAGLQQEKDTFKTDTDISGRTEIRERELHKWHPEDAAEDFGALESDTSTNGGGTWDQFAANEKLFGIKTDFDEELYTTRLDRSAPDFKDREKWAIEKANEIQRSAANNVHVLEERGMYVDDSGMDEEDRYGAVVRDTNKYMPPALRKQFQQEQQQQTSGKAAAADHKAEKPPVMSTSPLQNLTTSNLPKAMVISPSPVTHLPNAAGEKKPVDGQTTKRIEAEIAKTFRQFAMQEKDKLHAKKQALQKKEKEDRLAELMKFHQTFKLNVPVPADLVPLLSKGKKKDQGSPAGSSTTSSSSSSGGNEGGGTNKAAAAAAAGSQTTTTTSPEKDVKKTTTEKQESAAEKSTTTNGSSSSSAESKPTTATTTKSAFKFNVKATEFKPNPAAPVFIPSAKTATAAAAAAASGEGRQAKKTGPAEHLTIAEAFSSPFSKGKTVSPSQVGPTWPFGTKQYRQIFNQQLQYEEEMYTGYAAPGYPYGYPSYRYPPQFVPPVPVQQPYMSPQFVHNVPLTAAPMPHAAAAPPPPPAAVAGYSPQMPNVSPHGSPFPQAFSSPQRSPIVPHVVPPVYPYQGNGPHGGPMMMRYTPDGMPPNVTGSPGPVMIRPVMVEGGPMHFPPQQQQQQQHEQSTSSSSPS